MSIFRCEYGPLRDCPIHFLGIWDTVKSYGGFRPIILPHLRHNPIVKTEFPLMESKSLQRLQLRRDLEIYSDASFQFRFQGD